jgi:hypothetical protein
VSSTTTEPARTGFHITPASRSVDPGLGSDGPLFLHVELDGQGRPATGGNEPPLSTEAPWWPAAKLFGRYLSPWMAGRGRPLVDGRA